MPRSSPADRAQWQQMSEPLVEIDGGGPDEQPPQLAIVADSFTANRVLHALAFVTAAASFVQAQVELANVSPDWYVALHYDDRSNPRHAPIGVRWLDWHLALVTAPTAVHHLFMATRSKAWWRTYCQNRYSWYRWLEYSVTATAMTVRIAVLSGVNDISTLLALAVMSFAMVWLGAAHEWVAACPGTFANLPLGLLGTSGLLFLVQWTTILWTFQRAVSSADDAPA